MKKISEHLYLDEETNLYHYDSKLKLYNDEEIEELNKKYYANEETFIPEILADGYIEFPILFDNGPEPMWGKCYLPPEFEPSCMDGFKDKYKTNFNIYIPSYKRAGRTDTTKVLDSFGIENYYLCIDPSQYPDYKKHYPRRNIIIRDHTFKMKEKVELGSSVNAPDTLRGAVAAFNAILYLSKCLGETHYWHLDDDIMVLGMKAWKGEPGSSGKFEKYDKENFYRCSRLRKEVGFDLQEFMADLEETAMKMRNQSNVSIEKYGLVFTSPIEFKLGTRSYTFFLSDNRKQVDHIGQQNNDIITSLEMSKNGYVNMIFEGMCNYANQDTQYDAQGGSGGTTEVYKVFGTLDKGRVLVQSCPNYAKISHLHSRIHHVVDFKNYTQQRLLGAVKK